MDLKKLIHYVYDYPAEGILFRDLTGIWSDPQGLEFSTNEMCKLAEPYKPTKLVAMEARGFIVASSMAYKMGIGLTLIRKGGKLPPPTIKEQYENEYIAEGFIEIKNDELTKDDRVLFIDDILATGKSSLHASALIKKATGNDPLAFLFLLAIEELNGKDLINFKPVEYLIKD